MPRKKKVDNTFADMYAGIDKDVYASCSTDPGLAVQTLGARPPVMLNARFIHQMVLNILSGDVLAFSLEDQDGASTIVASEIGKTLAHMPDFLSSEDPRFIFSEHVRLFFSASRALGISLGKPLGAQESMDGRRPNHEIYNLLVRTIRRDGSAKAFTERVRIRQERSDRNYEQAKKYVSKLFGGKPLLVLRLDLAYAAGSYTWPNEEAMAALSADMGRFVNAMSKRSGPFKQLVGYISNLEFGVVKGDYYHVIFFFADSAFIDEQALESSVGQCWCDTVAKRRSRPAVYYRCRSSRNLFRGKGSGLISSSDKQRRATLMDGILYTALFDRYLKAPSQKGYHAFSTGRVVKKKTKAKSKVPSLNGDAKEGGAA